MQESILKIQHTTNPHLLWVLNTILLSRFSNSHVILLKVAPQFCSLSFRFFFFYLGHYYSIIDLR